MASFDSAPIVYTAVTSSHLPMFGGFFAPSLQRVGLVSETRILLCGDEGSSGSPGWIEALVQRCEMIRDLARCDRPFVWCDVDTMFFGHARKYLLETMESHPGCDLLASPDGSGNLVQAGFMLIRPTDRVRSFFSKLPGLVRVSGNDQPLIQEAVRRGELKVKLLDPRKFWYIAHADPKFFWYGHDDKQERSEYFNRLLQQRGPGTDAVFFHAARITAVTDKLTALSSVAAFMGILASPD